jgi:hypothetical protein
MEQKRRIIRPGRVRRLDPIPTNWYWLAALDPADLDSDFLGAIQERAQDQARPELESLFG